MTSARNCVICRQPFHAQSGDDWTCSQECQDQVAERAAMRTVGKILQGPGTTKDIPNPAEEARAALKGLMNLDPGGDEDVEMETFTPSGSTLNQQLAAAAQLTALADHMDDPADKTVMVNMARFYLESAQDLIDDSMEQQQSEES